MFIYCIRFISWFLFILPDFLLSAICKYLGLFLYYALASKRKLMIRNLQYSFPTYSLTHIQRIAKISCQRMVEMGILAVTLPFWNNKKILSHFKLSSSYKKEFEALLNRKEPILVLTSHFTLTEALSCISTLYDKPLPKVGVIYRPLGNKALDTWVKNTREKGGLRLLSRKSGLVEAMHILKNKGIICLLFDQNAGINGLETLFMNRPVYSTPLPSLIIEKFNPQVLLVYMEREGFLRGTLKHQIINQESPIPAIVQANMHLENLLKGNDNLCSNWLWMHDRWSMKKGPRERLSSHVKHTLMPETLAAYGLNTPPPIRRLFIRLPNWLGDIVMLVPLLKALRKARPDLCLTLIGKEAFRPLFQALHLGLDFISLPPKRGLAYWLYFWRLRPQAPETHILFTNSFRGDLEAFLIGSKERFGISRKGKYRPLLTHLWKIPPSIDESKTHQTILWAEFLKHFGLRTPPCLEAFSTSSTPLSRSKITLGFICGTENSPEKRWPISHWQTLITNLQKTYFSALQIKLFGTFKDYSITQTILEGLESKDNVYNLAGKTNIAQFIQELQTCHIVVGNDTGGLHLANLFGIPTIGLFGPTHSERTGPIFKVIHKALKAPFSKNQKPSMKNLEPSSVFSAIQELCAHLNTSQK